MNGSTNGGVVGFNLEKARIAADSLNSSFNMFSDLIVNSFDALAGMIFHNDNPDRGSNISYSWYAPEAVVFERNVFLPMFEKLFNDMHNLYADTYERVESSVAKWAITTGTTNVSLTHFTNTIAKGKTRAFPRAKSADKDGNIRISPFLYDEIVNKKHDVLTIYATEREEIVNALRSSEAFIGAGQQQMLAVRVKNMLDTVEKAVTELYDKAISEVMSTTERYQAIAKQIASSFNN